MKNGEITGKLNLFFPIMSSNSRSRSPSLENPLTQALAPQPKKPRPPLTDKQKENLKMGMEKLKQRRIEMAQEKETRKKTNELLKSQGLPPIEPPAKLKKKEVVVLPPVEKVAIKLPAERKPRADKGQPHIKKDMLEELTTMVRDLQTRTTTPQVAEPVVKEVVVEKPVEKIVERIVEKPVEKVVVKEISKSDLLNKIFFS